MAYHLSVPARINILGNPSDACEGDFATISAAVDMQAEACINEHHNLVLEQHEPSENGENNVTRLEFNSQDIPLPYDGSLDLIKGSINRLYRFSPELQDKISKRGFHFSTQSHIPRQSGLGGSSLFVLLTLAGLRCHYNLDPIYHNDYVLSELTQRVEAKELGIMAGFADRYVPLFGGIAYIDYRGKLDQKHINKEPYPTYEKLTPWVEEFPLVAITSGIQHNSGDVHGCMRPRYLEEHHTWVERGGDVPPMVKFMSGVWETAWKGKIALLQKDWFTFGTLMNMNHQLVDEMMKYCGFEDGAGWANNRLIETALENGALGAKLTGAGGGGSVFALTMPGDENKLLQAWEVDAKAAGLDEAKCFLPKISSQGLQVQEL
jgi:D-glycero-alpha-D-manno-heptose-7-phosphate kinase